MKTSYLPLVCSANAPYDGSCCTADSPCGEDEGDCDDDTDCQDGLQCGINNCPTGLNFPSDADCCFKFVLDPPLGGVQFPPIHSASGSCSK